ncbi:MAG: hypothetical protein OCC49_00045 [Fibrobacterales bacterium]
MYRLAFISGIAINLFVGCQSSLPSWIDEGSVQRLEFAQSTPFQVLNATETSTIEDAIALSSYKNSDAFENYYFLEGGDTAQLNTYLFSSEISAFGAYKSLGGGAKQTELHYFWYKNALFEFIINSPERFLKEINEFKKLLSANEYPAAFNYFPLQYRISESESVSNNGILGVLTDEQFLLIKYDFTTEKVTLAKSVQPIEKSKFLNILGKNIPLEELRYDEFTIYLIELDGTSVWLSWADEHLIAVFGGYGQKKSLKFIKKSLNIQKILN